jgi:hypothetical protein
MLSTLRKFDIPSAFFPSNAKLRKSEILLSANSLALSALYMVSSLHVPQVDLGASIWVPAMTFRIKRLCENHGTRICLSGELRYGDLVNLGTEIDRFGQPATLDLDEVSVVDIDGIRFLNECQTHGIQAVTFSPYIGEWMLQEKRARRAEE